MIRGFSLREPLRADASANLDDALNAKKALRRLGDFETPDYGLTPYPDRPLFDAVRRFQRREGLAEDGIVNPGGPTEAALNRALARGANNRRPKIDSGGSVTTIAAVPLIVQKIAEFFAISIAAAWAWWNSMSTEQRRRVRLQVERSDNADGAEPDCDHLLYSVDIPTCNSIAHRRGKRAAARCYASAQSRYAACLRGVPLDQLPPLDTWND